tara:strand:+ start:1302 stop:2381 length:1080 start_codon:yes stop_codon:yes gene_type:complete
MDSFKISALKYRPKSFDDVIGQELITSTLQNAIDTNQLPQALLFCGPRGVGKTTCARILAKTINKKENSSDENESFSYNIFELDAASNNSVEDIRNINEQIRIPPQTGKYKVYIIDEAHMLSLAAFNAFLKTLEEPPNYVIFVLATTEKNKLIPTILSRCQIFDFKRISSIEIKEFLIKISIKKKINYEEDALMLIAQKADGSLRDALSIFDRMINFTLGKINLSEVSKILNVLDQNTFLKISDLIKNKNIPKLLLESERIIDQGYDPLSLINGLSSHIRMLILSKDSSTINLLEVGEKLQKQYLEQSKEFTLDSLIGMLRILKEGESNNKISLNKRLNLELCLMQLASLHFNGEKKNL